MNEAAYRKFQLVYEQLDTDPIFLDLQLHFSSQEQQFRKLMGQLSQEQQDIFIEYIGLLSEAYLRILEIACYTE